MDSQQGPTGQHMELCSMSCGSLDGRGVWGRMDMCICMLESHVYSPETIAILLIGYTSTQNKHFKRKNKMDNQQGPTAWHRELCSMLCSCLDGRELRGRMDTCTVWPSPFAGHLKLSQHC